MLTPGDRDYHHVWTTPIPNEQTFTFSVTACKEAIVVLSQTPGDTLKSAYELTIGSSDNTKSVLKKVVDEEFEIVAEVNSFDILDCSIATSFWITWSDGIIKVGRGDRFMYQFLIWEDPEENYPRIHAISLTNENNNALWRFQRDQGKAGCGQGGGA